VTFRKLLRSVTVEEDDAGFRDFVRAAKQGDDKPTEARKARAPKQVSPEGSSV
jgi:hypothetical protein